ncbi:hypothetical protein [Mycobacterium sp. M23085]|uniref:hypothetical protein n=1 Tax=Mycobacterium sp. M23085 TaxID=3378087 RepID=UPI00387811D4
MDIDLDFFVWPVVYRAQGADRPLAKDHSVKPIDEAIDYLRTRCGLSERLPGFVTENHSELFGRWREAVGNGLLRPPFHVTHLDAHADLGMGDGGYEYLLTSLLFEPPEQRLLPMVDRDRGLTDGNWLLFAIACRWISDLIYVHDTGGGSDELRYVMQNFDLRADNIQLAAMTKSQLDRVRRPAAGPPNISDFEPPVRYQSCLAEAFETDGPYDFICLTRSPPYTPNTADPLFDEIVRLFIEPIHLPTAQD